jgi:CBS domain containing-hemolysin-like protein
MIAIDIAVLTVLVFVNAFFVAAEFAIVKIRTSQLEPLASQGRLTARAAVSIVRNLNTYLSACQLGITLASLGLGWIGEPVVAEILKPLLSLFDLPPEWVHYIALPAAFATITFLHITLGEQAPKILAIQKERATTLTVSIPLLVFYQIFRPFIWAINGTSNLILKAIGLHAVEEHKEALSADELRLMVAATIAGGELSQVERRVMQGVLDIRGKIARQIMVARPDIIALDQGDPLEKNVRVVIESGRTRFPLCDGSLDKVIGMIHAHDMLRALADEKDDIPVGRLKRKILMLPETIDLNLLLRRFQKERIHMAVLLDEYGGVAGMATLEDVLEELVGQIQDEFDDEAPLVVNAGEGRYTVAGKCHLDDIAAQCGVTLPEAKADTVGGLVTELIGHIPKRGERVRVGRHRFTVIDAVPTHVRLVEIFDGGEPAEADAGNEHEK